MWINNCVGWRNRKFYILFLLYSFLSCVVGVLIVLDAVYHFLLVRNMARRLWLMEYFWSMFYALMLALALASYFGH